MKKRWKKINITFLISIFFIIFAILLYYYSIALPIIKTYSMAETRSITEKAVNVAVSNVVNRTLSYESLIDINYSPKGEITSFSANQYEINSITREIVKEAQYHINNLSHNALKLNLGTFTGVPFFIGRGPLINLKLVPIGSVNSSFQSEFNSVGINMTKHTLYLYINVHVNIVLPIKSFDLITKNQVMLAESIIVGKVPEVYLNGSSLGKSLNLIP